MQCTGEEILISTHAPAGGATFKDIWLVGDYSISTHAPAGGATTPLDTLLADACLFLLTPLREGRQCLRAIWTRSRSISTHAPAGGATRQAATGSSPETNFYSRPCGRGDVDLVLLIHDAVAFLLTPLREGRLRDADKEIDQLVISTHAPAGGATVKVRDDVGNESFLLTPLREGRLGLYRKFLFAYLFLLTPLREGRLDALG